MSMNHSLSRFIKKKNIDLFWNATVLLGDAQCVLHSAVASFWNFFHWRSKNRKCNLNIVLEM